MTLAAGRDITKAMHNPKTSFHPWPIAIAIAIASLMAIPVTAPSARAADHDDTAVVEMVMAGSLECPFTARAWETVKTLRAEYGDRLAFRWLHRPLPFHDRAVPAAIAAEAARNQGRFDAFVEKALTQLKTLGDADLERFARELRLDIARFKADLGNPETAARVKRDTTLADAVGATATPTFFINGRSLRGAQPATMFREVIDEEIEAFTIEDSPRGKRLERLIDNHAELFGYLYGGVEPAPPAPRAAPVDTTRYRATVAADDPAFGPATAPVTLVVFGGYQCSFTRRLNPTLEALRAKYKDDLRIVHKQSPLPFHTAGTPAAKAALCAQAQGRFAPMHAALLVADLEGADDANAAVRTVASGAGLDMARFERCLADAATEAKLVADLALAEAVTARGTPVTYVNGRKLMGAKPQAEFEALIDEQLTEARTRLRAGAAPAALYTLLMADARTFEPLDTTARKIDTTGAARLGPANAKIQIAIFGSLQCPFTHKALPGLAQLVDRHRGKLSVTFHHFPLDFQREARPAAERAVCAEEQGKGWRYIEAVLDMHDRLFEGLDEATAAAGLDAGKLAACMASGRAAKVVARHLANGTESDVRATPTVFIQGRKATPSGGLGPDILHGLIERFYPELLR